MIEATIFYSSFKNTRETPQTWKINGNILHTHRENCLSEFYPEVLPDFGPHFSKQTLWDKANVQTQNPRNKHINNSPTHKKTAKTNNINKIRTQTQ